MDVAPSHPGSDPLPDRILPPPAPGGEWTLDRTRDALAALGNPQDRMATLHVAGTNGKGSVAAVLASVLDQAGHRTGLYTSPHLCAFRERFRVGRTPISRVALTAAAGSAYEAIEQARLTYFEAATVLGFQAFAREGVDVAVIEVGLGGRLDATNVIRPAVSVITNVALDHQAYLGDTLESIAVEKAGILKPGVPAVTGEREGRVLDVLRREAAAQGTSLVQVPESGYRIEPTGPFNPEGSDPDSVTRARAQGAIHGVLALDGSILGRLRVTLPLAGAHQAHNVAVAIRALEALPRDLVPAPDQVASGVAKTRWPGRFQVEALEGRTWIFDVAHNPAAASALRETLYVLDPPGPRVGVLGVLQDKDRGAMIPTLARVLDHLILTDPPSAPPERRLDPRVLAAELVSGSLDLNASVQVEPELVTALALARDLAPEGTILVTGSHHTVGDALMALDRAPCEPG